jgi:hypothetical protein
VKVSPLEAHPFFRLSTHRLRGGLISFAPPAAALLRETFMQNTAMERGVGPDNY